MKFDITLKQYEIIYRIVASVGEHFAHGAGYSCQFYNVLGAFVLEQMLKVEARPVMGVAFIKLSEENVLAFAGQEDRGIYSSPDAFHCWVETKNNYIDFTAPEYREAASDLPNGSSTPRKMFQKPKESMSTDPFDLEKPGDYFFSVNPALTNHLLGKMFSRSDSKDFAHICCDWFEKYKKGKIDSMTVMNDLGEMTPVKMKSSNLCDKW